MVFGYIIRIIQCVSCVFATTKSTTMATITFNVADVVLHKQYYITGCTVCFLAFKIREKNICEITFFTVLIQMGYNNLYKKINFGNMFSLYLIFMSLLVQLGYVVLH